MGLWRALMHKKLGTNKKKRFSSEMWENAAFGRGACKNPVGFSVYEGQIETIQYNWVNSWCMPD